MTPDNLMALAAGGVLGTLLLGVCRILDQYEPRTTGWVRFFAVVAAAGALWKMWS